MPLSMFNRSRWWSYTLLLLFLGVCSVIIISWDIATKKSNLILPIICVIVTGLYFLGTLFLGERSVKRELKRRFHV